LLVPGYARGPGFFSADLRGRLGITKWPLRSRGSKTHPWLPTVAAERLRKRRPRVPNHALRRLRAGFPNLSTRPLSIHSPPPGPRPPARGGERAAMPCDLSCSCGARLAGQRQATHQVVTCEKCGERRFILPISPLPDPPSESTLLPPSTSRHRLVLGLAGA